MYFCLKEFNLIVFVSTIVQEDDQDNGKKVS
jgi:hypothetical protein